MCYVACSRTDLMRGCTNVDSTHVYARWVSGDEPDVKFANFGAATIRANPGVLTV